VTWLLTAIFTGCGFLAYIIGWIVMPVEPERVYVPPVPNTNQQTVAS
jgi:phage shock protein PspC (stress-responsive transcriptional regulator)